MLFLLTTLTNAQKNNIKISDIPEDVKTTLTSYMDILLKSTSPEDAADKLFKAGIIAGGLLNTSGTGPSNDIISFSLKKDFENVKFYEFPPVITGVTYTESSYDGWQNTLVEGKHYKIWVNKKAGVQGRPAPVPIIKPAQGKPVVISVIGSF